MAMELLYESRRNLSGMSGMLRFVQHQPTIRPTPVLLPDSPGDANGVSIYGSVHHVDGLYRMWYYAVTADFDGGKDGNGVAYAESVDGETWTKPVLDLVPGLPAGNNHTDLGLHSATVFVDPHSPPERRYRAVGCGKEGVGANPGVTRRGYYTAYSGDGLRWTLDSNTPRWSMIDVVTSIYHSGRDCGMVALKRTPAVGRIARRSIYTAEYSNGVYGDDVSALFPDEYDDIQAVSRGYHSCDYYGMGMMPAGADGTVGFLWRYWHQLPYSKGWGVGPQALYGSSDISLVYQMDRGGRWLHVPGRPLFIDVNHLPSKAGWINSASNVITVGDEQRLYFTYRPHPHGYGLNLDWKRDAGVFPMERSCISYASWPKDRLLGFEASRAATLHIGLGDVDRPSRLYLNVDATKPGAYVRAELTADDTVLRPAASAVPIVGDQVAGRVAWEDGDVIAPGTKLKLRLELFEASVYAYEVRPI